MSMTSGKTIKRAALIAENERLRRELAALKVHLIAAALWCPAGACEFKKLRVEAPPVEDFAANFLRLVEGKEP